MYIIIAYFENSVEIITLLTLKQKKTPWSFFSWWMLWSIALVRADALTAGQRRKLLKRFRRRSLRTDVLARFCPECG